MEANMGADADNNENTSNSLTDIPQIVETAIGPAFQKHLGDSAPWLDHNESLQTSIVENKWTRWDGVEDSAESHMVWMQQQAQSLMSAERHDEYRPYGAKNGIQYFIHDELTAAGNGYGFFKLQGTLRLEPRDLVACMFDFGATVELDPTVVLMKTLHAYVQMRESVDPSSTFITASYWCNAPGFPFYYRDAVDLSGFCKDEETGTVWQLALSMQTPTTISNNRPYDSIPARNRYWAYRLQAKGDGTTQVTLICQTELNGWIPKFLSNYMVCSVLVDSMATTERKVQANKESGVHDHLLQQLGLQHL